MSNAVYEKTLYGLTKKNKAYVWSISVFEQAESSHGEIVISRGLLDGKKHKTLQVITSGKNIGKVNETTPISQAIFNATSKVRKSHQKASTNASHGRSDQQRFTGITRC